MKLPAAAGPSTRFPIAAGVFGADVTGGWETASGEAAAGLVDATGPSGFALAERAGDSARGTGERDADRAGTV